MSPNSPAPAPSVPCQDTLTPYLDSVSKDTRGGVCAESECVRGSMRGENVPGDGSEVCYK